MIILYCLTSVNLGWSTWFTDKGQAT